MPQGNTFEAQATGDPGNAHVKDLRRVLEAHGRMENGASPEGGTLPREEVMRALAALLREDPAQAAELFIQMGVRPEEFVALIMDTDPADGLTFDVDENELATAIQKIETPPAPMGIDPVTKEWAIPEGRTKDDVAAKPDRPGAALEAPKEPPPGPRGVPPQDGFETLRTWVTDFFAPNPNIRTAQPQGPVDPDPTLPGAGNPVPGGVFGPGGETGRPGESLAAPAPAPSVSTPPPRAPVPPAPAAPSRDPNVPPTEPPAPGMAWVFDTPSGQWTQSNIIDGNPIAAPPSEPRPPVHPTAPLEVGGVTAGSDGTASTGGAPAPGLAGATVLSGGSANPGVVASPVDAGTTGQSQALQLRLGQMLQGVQSMGDPAMPEVATPGAPPGAGAPGPGGDLLALIARIQAGQAGGPPMRLGQALSLGG